MNLTPTDITVHTHGMPGCLVGPTAVFSQPGPDASKLTTDPIPYMLGRDPYIVCHALIPREPAEPLDLPPPPGGGAR